jgi:flavin-dependent dehydrogenase
LAATLPFKLEKALMRSTGREIGLVAADRCDAIVIGGGPAGSMAARELARRGLHVVLVERKRFPRSKVCGACLNQRAVSWLEMAGLADLLPRLNAVPIDRFRAFCGRRSVEIELPGGAAVSRESLDMALAEAAVACGATLITGTTAALLDDRDDRGYRLVELRGADGRQAIVRARLVLAADGLGHPSLIRCREFEYHVDPASKIGVQTCLPTTSIPWGTIFMAIGSDGYVGMVRLEDGGLNLAAAIAPRKLKNARTPAMVIEGILDRCQVPKVDLSGCDAWHGTPPLTQSISRPVGHRVFVLGDAAGYVEPFTGEGIAWAFASGLAVAPFAERGLKEWNGQLEREWQHAYGSLVRDRQFWCRGFAAVLRRPYAASLAVRLAASFPSLCRPIVAGLNRKADSTSAFSGLRRRANGPNGRNG